MNAKEYKKEIPIEEKTGDNNQHCFYILKNETNWKGRREFHKREIQEKNLLAQKLRLYVAISEDK